MFGEMEKMVVVGLKITYIYPSICLHNSLSLQGSTGSRGDEVPSQWGPSWSPVSWRNQVRWCTHWPQNSGCPSWNYIKRFSIKTECRGGFKGPNWHLQPHKKHRFHWSVIPETIRETLHCELWDAIPSTISCHSSQHWCNVHHSSTGFFDEREEVHGHLDHASHVDFERAFEVLDFHPLWWAHGKGASSVVHETPKS